MYKHTNNSRFGDKPFSNPSPRKQGGYYKRPSPHGDGSSSRPSTENRGHSRGFRPSGDFRGRPSFRGKSSFGGRGRGRGGFAPRKRSFGEHIDISMFIKKASEIKETKAHETKHTFADFNFCKEINTNLTRKKFITPSPIQDISIPLIMEGKDVIGLANTGTGKTGAFLLPLIEKINKNRKEKVLIMAPTRELAIQIDTEFRQFSEGMHVYSAVCVGGAAMGKQLFALKRNPHFIIGTPGRLKDMISRKAFAPGSITNVVLDEVDRMLDMGFINDIRKILSEVAKPRQSLFFSATMPPKIKSLAGEFLKDPSVVEVKSGVTTDNVDQDVVRIHDKAMKFDTLEKLLKEPGLEKVIIFSETKRGVEKLTSDLVKKGFRAESIHGDKRQSQRERALDRFRTNRANILVATDVAARGLDIKDITHVINYTVPQTYDDYIHRIGRTGRAGKKGKALTFV